MGGIEMSKSRGNMKHERDAEGRFDNANKAAYHSAAHRSRSEAAQERCRDSRGRFEKCGVKMDKHDQGGFDDCGCAAGMDKKDKKSDKW
jgi:hypothetical protein